MKIIAGAIAVLLSLVASQASVIVNPWVPIFKGIDHATGREVASDGRLLAVNALRIDLHDPDVQMFTDPPCTNCAVGYETLGYTTSRFLKTYGVQVAVNANFYSPCCAEPQGAPFDVIGLSISRGRVVSYQENAFDADNVMFTTNKQVTMLRTNYPSAKTNGIYTAVSGHYTLLTNGVNIGYTYTNDFTDPTIHLVQPRTAVGVSQDGRYLYLITIDGRQTGYSNGSFDQETGDWLIRFGSYNGVNLDGGGSTTMVMADCVGNPIQLNIPIDQNIPGHERVIGNHLGVFAKPLPGFINDVVVTPGDTFATVTWTTVSNATTQVQYGPDASYGSSTPLDSTPLTNHSATLTSLTPGTINYFQVISTIGAARYTDSCYFTTTNNVTMLFDVTKSWKWTTNNLDGINWQARGYNDSNWFGPGPGLLYVENSAAVSPRNTPLPPNNGVQTQGVCVYPTYYFRTHFTFTNSTTGVSLVFSNFIDDGAVFYLNGVEIQRVRMPPPPAGITYTTTTGGIFPCVVQNPPGGDATCPDIFTISGDLATNLVSGDNVLAVEVHQYIACSFDITFGSALGYAHPGTGPPPPTLSIMLSGGNAIILWTGGGFTLQQSSAPAASWVDVPGPVTTSPYLVTPLPGASRFYRLRN